MVGERGQFKVRASKGVHLVVPRDRFHSKMGMIFRTEKSVLFVIPWGRHWLDRHDRHRLGPRQGPPGGDRRRHRLHPRARQQGLAVPLTRADVEGVYAGLRRCSRASPTRRRSSVARAHRGPHRARSRRRRGRQVDDLPGHGRGRDRRGRRRPRRSHPGEHDDGDPAARRRGLPRRLEQARQDRARRSACTRCASSTCSTATARSTDEILDLIRERPDARRAAARAPTTTSAPRSSTPRATRAPCTSRTCSPAAPASRSRRGTAGSPPLPSPRS